jgi:cobalt-precorrin 5A hydrolase
VRRIVSLTEAGQRLGRKIDAALGDSELWHKPEPFGERVRQAFGAGDALIMICATGIAVRTLAPVIASKHSDPPVLVLDEAGKFVIPLLSGHEGGANDLAAQVASLIDAQLVLTTARDYLRPVYAAGLGCERGCGEAEMGDLLGQCLAKAGIGTDQLISINSIDIKADEAGLLALAERQGLPFATYGAQALRRYEHLLSTRSDYVFDTVGVYGVAESAALLAAAAACDAEPELVVEKQKSRRATCAIARAYPEEDRP